MHTRVVRLYTHYDSCVSMLAVLHSRASCFLCPVGMTASEQTRCCWADRSTYPTVTRTATKQRRYFHSILSTRINMRNRSPSPQHSAQQYPAGLSFNRYERNSMEKFTRKTNVKIQYLSKRKCARRPALHREIFPNYFHFVTWPFFPF